MGKINEDFRRWCDGETGYPIVDAGIRQLNTTGFMHNRLRMITAMFLTKDLHIDWRHGERYFMQKLADGEIASNNGGWQWSAGTGADAAPYFAFRIHGRSLPVMILKALTSRNGCRNCARSMPPSSCAPLRQA